MTHILVDTANTFFRARHVIRGDASEKIGMAIHITLNSIKKAWNDFDGSHVVFCLEGRSWRKDHYAPYKRNRKELADAMTATEQEENKLFWECYDDFVDFIRTKTNVTVLQNGRCEADDLIARWIDKHPDQQHVIISTDKDLNQLIAPNVRQYNGIAEETMTVDGYFDKKGNPVIDKKTKEHRKTESAEWTIFEKAMRGDPSDNIFSAYPGVRKKGTKSKVGLLEAFEDRNNKGYAWNNLMLSKWMDPEGVEHRVIDDYERNRLLVDLHAQPEAIVQELDQTIAQCQSRKQTDITSGHKIYEILCQIRSTKNYRTSTTICRTIQCEISMTMRAKILVKDKFWIIEENGQKLGTLQKKDDNGWIFLGKKDQRQEYPTQESLICTIWIGYICIRYHSARKRD
jgi:5'-3' exonuclease